MSDPTGSGARRRPHRFGKVKEAHAKVREVNEQLGLARQVHGPKHPVVKKLVSDSIAATDTRKRAIKDYQRGQ
jgi:hypothetical protein